jgi:Optic atrophy 3 protein (OPA3)
MATELGANLLGEFVIFAIGAGILILEYVRQSAKETMKEQMILQEKMELQAMLNELAFQAERQDTQIRELSRIIADIRKLLTFSLFCDLYYKLHQHILILNLKIQSHGHLKLSQTQKIH